MTWVVVIATVPDGAPKKWRPRFERSIVSIKSYAEGETGINDDDPSILEAFDDYTLNFEDLGYWNARDDLDGKTLAEVTIALESAIERLRAEGVVARKSPSGMFLLPCWWFGMKRVPGSCMPELGPPEERKPVIMMHLQDLLETAKEYANKENVKFYLFD
jgi:hypothetical protein